MKSISVVAMWSFIFFSIPSYSQTTTLEFDAIRDAEGNVQLVPKIGSAKEPIKTPTEVDQAGTMKAAEQESIEAEWLVVRSPEGTVMGAWPASKSGFADIFLQTAPEGSVLEKTKYGEIPAAFIQAATSSLIDDVTAAIREMAEKAVETVCAIKARPSTFRLVTSVSAHLGIGGKVELDMTWQTAELCVRQ